MLAVRLLNSSNLKLLVSKQSRCLIKSFHTSRLNCESETSKLIRLRREREAKEEQTTGFDKMINFNEYHLQMMKKHDTPEIIKKRNIALIKMMLNIVGFIGGSFTVITFVFWIYNMQVGNNIFDVRRSDFID